MAEEALKTEQDYPEVEVNAFWIRKMRTVFRRLDYTGTGIVLLDDLLDVATGLMLTYPAMADYKADDLVNAMFDLWFQIIAVHMPPVERARCSVSEHTFVENMKSNVNGKLKESFVDILVDPLFHAVDQDDDKKITKAEFFTLMKSWKGIERDAENIFRLLDNDRDGKITTEEFRFAMAEHFFCECQKTCKFQLMWGPLVNYKRPEDFGEVLCGPFWEGKIRNMFRRLDVTGKGKLKCKDFIKIARGIIKRGRLDKKKADAVTHAMLNIWVKYMAVGPDGVQYHEITEKEFVHNMRNMINGPFRHEIDQFGWTFFKSVELEGNGKISFQEYRNLQEAWNVGREESEALFKAIGQWLKKTYVFANSYNGILNEIE